MNYLLKNYRLIDLINMITVGELLVQPAYQRNFIWDENKKKLLIDSIFKGWVIPPVFFVNQNNNGYKYEIIDGLQRMSTIGDFYNNKLADVNGTKYSEMDDNKKQYFLEYPLPVIVIQNIERNEIGEYFFRLNDQIVLSDVEKRNAYQSTFRNDIHRITKKYEEIYFSDRYLGFENNRLIYQDILSRVAIYLDNKTLDLKINQTSDLYYKGLKKMKRKTLNTLEDSLNEFCRTLRMIKNSNYAVSWKPANVVTWLYVLATYPSKYGIDISRFNRFIISFENARYSILEDMPIVGISRNTREYYDYLMKAFNYFMSKSPMNRKSTIFREYIIRILFFDYYEDDIWFSNNNSFDDQRIRINFEGYFDRNEHLDPEVFFTNYLLDNQEITDYE